jgi:hypothetical protein
VEGAGRLFLDGVCPYLREDLSSEEPEKPGGAAGLVSWFRQLVPPVNVA